MDSSSCNHQQISLIQADIKERYKCRHCHLTITSDELGQNGFCPECYETTGRKNHDFDAVETVNSDKVRYRCDGCGVIIEC